MKKILALTIAFACAFSLNSVAEDEKKEREGKGGKDGSERAAAILEKLDTDGNGSISKAEFLASDKAQSAKADGRDPEKFFEMKDADGSGEISVDEMGRKGGKGKGGKGKGVKGKGGKGGKGKGGDTSEQVE